MTANLNRHTHISNYQKALISLFDKKEIWDYLNEERKAALKKKVALKRKKELSKSVLSKSDEVIYH